MNLKSPARKQLIALLLVLVSALTIRIIYINQLKSNPFFNEPIIDSQEYHKMALKIADGKAPRDDAFYQPPLYSYFLGILYRLWGPDFFTIRLLQMLLGVFNIFLTYLLARRIFGFKISLISAIAMSLYGTMLFFEGELLAPVIIVSLNLLLMIAMLGFMEKQNWQRALGCGIILGLSAVTMAVILPFAAVATAAWFFFLHKTKDKRPAKEKTIIVLCFLTGIAMVILPVTLTNLKRSNEPVLISSNGGINFYLGTGADFERKVSIRPGYEWKQLMREPLEAGYTSPAEQSGYFLDKSMKLIAKDPLGFLWGTVKKFYLFANGNEIMRNQEIYPFRGYSSVLSVLLWKNGIAFPYGLLFPLAIIGVFFAIRRKIAKNYLLLLFSAAHIVVIVLFFISARYRMNILPFLIIQAAYGGYVLWERISRKDYRGAAVPGVLLLGLLLVCNLNTGPMPDSFNADAWFNLGANYMAQKKPEAKEMFEKALQQDPDFPDANGNMGIILDMEGDHRGAVDAFKKVLARYPDDVDANSQLGIAYYNLGNFQKARTQFQKVLTLDKENEIATYNLNIINRKIPEPAQQDPDRLLTDFRSQLEKDPDNPELSAKVGMALMMKKEFAKALKYVRRAIDLNPNFPQAHNNLGIIFLELGAREKAKKEFETALKLAPDYELAKKNLERLMKSSKQRRP